MFAKIIKKLNNFRFTAILMSAISGVAAVYSLLSLFLYHFSHGIKPRTNNLVRIVGFDYGVLPEGLREIGPYLGMILYFASMITLFISIFVVYSCVPFIKNKEKVNPRKSLLMTGFVCTFFELVLIALMILLIAVDTPNTLVAIIVSLPFGVLSAIGTGLYLIPWLKCDFYMPEIKRD